MTKNNPLQERISYMWNQALKKEKDPMSALISFSKSLGERPIQAFKVLQNYELDNAVKLILEDSQKMVKGPHTPWE
jgi:hypothetical protein